MKRTVLQQIRMIWSAVLCAALLAVGTVGGAYAQSSGAARDSITLSPVSQRLDIAAGEAAAGKLTVVNDGTVPETFIVYARPYSVKTEAYTPDYDTKSTNTDIYQWVRFEQTAYTLSAGETKDIPYTIQVPAGAAPGGHYGVIFVETQPKDGSSDSVIRKKRIGTILLATVSGQVSRSGSVLSTDASFWQPTPPLTVSSRVQSTGNTDIQATANVKVTDVFGNVKFESTKDYTIYPGTTRRIISTWDQAPWFGLFRATQTMTVLGKDTTATHYVLIAPRWLPIALVILLIIGGVYAWYRRRKNH